MSAAPKAGLAAFDYCTVCERRADACRDPRRHRLADWMKVAAVLTMEDRRRMAAQDAQAAIQQLADEHWVLVDAPMRISVGAEGASFELALGFQKAPHGTKHPSGPITYLRLPEVQGWPQIDTTSGRAA